VIHEMVFVICNIDEIFFVPPPARLSRKINLYDDDLCKAHTKKAFLWFFNNKSEGYKKHFVWNKEI
jgi:hypothetical protein